ncbi:HD-GYP domain-containing protein [Azotosporobacter soli]|uniref:HD-GYP domain-containing protein n=1 Tax=Azotosporobacter soli TaxID=3055040 RepID=UPI0031FF1DAF
MEMRKRSQILIVEDSEVNVDILVEALGDDYEISVALDGETALLAVGEAQPDLILLDIVMPGLSGYEVCQRLKKNKDFRHIPIIFLTSLTDEADEAKGLSLGAVDYIIKPYNLAMVKARVRNHLELKRYHDSLEELVALRTGELEATKRAIIGCMAVLGEFRDTETGAHTQRTQEYVSVLLTVLDNEEAKMSVERKQLLCQSAVLHDIGKIAVPDAILQKPGPLTAEEFEEMKKHTLVGGLIIRRAEQAIGHNSFLGLVGEIAEFHHEKWDGSGYPHGLKGKEIPFGARLMALADIYDALISVRPYKKGFSHEEALQIILDGDGRTKPEHFDPEILAAFAKVHESFRNIGQGQ